MENFIENQKARDTGLRYKDRQIMKVYCENCKFKGFLLCIIMSKGAIHNTYNGNCIGFKVHTDNRYGDCKYYKRKWYKFWIKQT